MVATVKVWFSYDDSLDAFGVHGAGGTLGALLTGVFASSAINPIFRNAQGNVLPSGLVEGDPRQLVNQLVGIGVAWSLAIVGTLIALRIVDEPPDCESGSNMGFRDWILRSTAKKATNGTCQPMMPLVARNPTDDFDIPNGAGNLHTCPIVGHDKTGTG